MHTRLSVCVCVCVCVCVRVGTCGREILRHKSKSCPKPLTVYETLAMANNHNPDTCRLWVVARAILKRVEPLIARVIRFYRTWVTVPRAPSH